MEEHHRTSADRSRAQEPDEPLRHALIYLDEAQRTVLQALNEPDGRTTLVATFTRSVAVRGVAMADRLESESYA